VADRPATIRGHDARELISWVQKAIRRGLVDDALYAACELERSGFGPWLWKRLRVITSEDVGPAWPEGPAVIYALYETYTDLRRSSRPPHRTRPWRLVTTHAVILLAQAPKSRIADWTALHFYGSLVEDREVPDYALDKHTARGRRMGRGVEHFVAEGSRLERHEPVDGEAEYRELAAAALEAGGPLGDAETPAQTTLFET
jgi:replication-associated recombination protein RarA